MEYKKIYLVRHGRIRVDDEQKSFIGQIDLPMSNEGEKEVRIIGEKLSRIKINSIFCSDLVRSVATAEIIASYHGIIPIPKNELREIFLGDWEGLSFAEVIRRYPDEFKRRGADIVNFHPPHGESFYDCSQRVIAAFNEIVRTSNGNIVIAGHAGINRLILCNALGMPIENIFNISQDYACLNIILSGNTHFRVMLLNYTGSI